MIIHKFLDPKNDVAFKRIFGSEKNKDILIHFLNDTVVFSGKKPIQDVTFLKPIQDPEIAAQKTSIVDVLCTDHAGNTYIVEMQVAKTQGFEKRAQYYAAKAYTSQLNAGGAYHDLKEVIFLAIADYVVFPHKTGFKSDHITLDRLTHDHDLQGFSFTFIELPKFTKEIHALETLLDKWCYFFKHAPGAEPDALVEFIETEPVMKKAYTELDSFFWTSDELLTYERVIKKENDYLSSLSYQFDQGKEEGLQEGIEKGKKEEKRAIAHQMLAKGLPLEMVCELTALTQEEIYEKAPKA